MLLVSNPEEKLVILYGFHEPTSTIVEQLKLPKNVIAIKHPFVNTPRGVYINTRRI